VTDVTLAGNGLVPVMGKVHFPLFPAVENHVFLAGILGTGTENANIENQA
jgi:hypothetical protein